MLALLLSGTFVSRIAGAFIDSDLFASRRLAFSNREYKATAQTTMKTTRKILLPTVSVGVSVLTCSVLAEVLRFMIGQSCSIVGGRLALMMMLVAMAQAGKNIQNVNCQGYNHATYDNYEQQTVFELFLALLLGFPRCFLCGELG